MEEHRRQGKNGEAPIGDQLPQTRNVRCSILSPGATRQVMVDILLAD
jgi:hypothetical protein